MRFAKRARASFVRSFLLLLAAISFSAPVLAGETLTYTFDELGRLTKVVRTGTVNNNATECYNYDPASNRSNVTIATSSDCSSGTLTLSPTNLPNGTVGTAYSQTITASGGTSPYTFAKTVGTLPAGLTLSSGGALSGTPTTAATSSFTITGTDSASHTGSRAYSVTINSTGTLTLSPTTLPNGTIGTAYSQTITASGGTAPYTYSKTAGTLPAGLSLSSGGVLSGTPTTAATSSFTITGTDSASHTGSRAYSVTIAAAGNQPPVANFDNAGSMTCGDTIIVNVVANDTDPDGNYPLSLVSASGGGGVNVSVSSSTQVQIIGITAGTKSFTYVVQDSLGALATGSGSVVVTAPCQ